MAIIHIKVVPGARRNRVVGRYGDATKVQVCAPPEHGKANQAVVRLLTEALGVKGEQVRILRGHTSPRKTIEIVGLDQSTADERLRLN